MILYEVLTGLTTSSRKGKFWWFEPGIDMYDETSPGVFLDAEESAKLMPGRIPDGYALSDNTVLSFTGSSMVGNAAHLILVNESICTDENDGFNNLVSIRNYIDDHKLGKEHLPDYSSVYSDNPYLTKSKDELDNMKSIWYVPAINELEELYNLELRGVISEKLKKIGVYVRVHPSILWFVGGESPIPNVYDEKSRDSGCVLCSTEYNKYYLHHTVIVRMSTDGKLYHTREVVNRSDYGRFIRFIRIR